MRVAISFRIVYWRKKKSYNKFCLHI